MSPEQALGTTLTPATDLYSLGVVAWEMLAGQVPFEETDTPVAVLYRHVHEPVPSVLTVSPEVDPAIAQWLERMLAKAPEERYQSADEAWVELEDVVLELLGPRWRREARLAVEQEEERRGTGKSLTPAAFESASVEAVETPGEDPAPLAHTVTDEPAAAPAEATVAPKQRPQRSHTTMMRIARRHADAGDDIDESRTDTMRRRLTVLGIVVAMAAAIAAGLLVANSGSGGGPSAAQLATQRKAAEQRQLTATTNRRLATIMQGFAATDNRDQAALNNATTPDAQASAATTLQRAFAHAGKQVGPLGSDSPAAAPLHTTIERIAAAYARLAAAARAGRARSYNAAAAAIRSEEKSLYTEVSKL
jgi:hypothetical protein